MYDLFICHASEDKDAVVEPLVRALVDAGVNVWYDRFSLKLGDSLRQKIEEGLADSRFGLVILSPNFFSKNWPQSELNGLFSKEMSGVKTILPVWHQVDRDYIVQRAPMLSDRVATLTKDGLDHVAQEVLNIVKPDRVHTTRTGLTISATPPSIRLHTGEWQVRTPVTVFNHSESTLHSIQIQILIQSTGVPCTSVRFDPGPPTTSLRGETSGFIFSPDVFAMAMTGFDGKEFVVLTIHTLGPKQGREISVWGTVAVPSTADVRVLGFDTNPTELLQRSS